ncbi:MAG: sigma-70 family RNA polymerase sigma factor [Chloroflexota bacterium]
MSGTDVSKPPARHAPASTLASDARLARRAAQRDEKAFAAIFRRYHQEIYRFCLAILGNAEDARDALQNTMVKALQSLPGEDRQIQLRPWLYRVAHNEAVEIVRTRTAPAPIDPELEDPAGNLADAVGARERLRRLLCDLADLPDRQRTALVMRELSGLGFAQIGEFFGTSEAVARQAVYEARLSLRSLEAGREMSCEEVMHRLSNADGRVTRRRDLKAHLRDCPDCRAFQVAIETRRRDFAAIAPLPTLASAGVLHAVLGSAQGAVGGAATATGGATAAAGAGKALTAGLVAKSVATVAVVAAVGVSAADRSGLIHTGLTGGSSSTPAGQESGSGAAGGETEGGSPRGAKAKRQAARARKRAKAHGKKGKGHHGQGAPGALPPAAQHGRETAAEHRQNSGVGGGRSQGASHRQSHHASHGRGHARAPAHSSPPPATSSPPKSSKEEGGKGSTGETSPTPEQSSGFDAGGAKSGTKSEGMP